MSAGMDTDTCTNTCTVSVRERERQRVRKRVRESVIESTRMRTLRACVYGNVISFTRTLCR